MGNALALCWGISRIACYSVYKKLFLPADLPPRAEFSLLMLGFDGAGKTTLLAELAGEDTTAITPTKGRCFDLAHATSHAHVPIQALPSSLLRLRTISSMSRRLAVQLLNDFVASRSLTLNAGDVKMRKYWNRYFDGVQGLMYVIDGSSEDSEMKESLAMLADAAKGVPFPKLLILSKADQPQTMAAGDLKELLPRQLADDPQFLVISTSKDQIDKARMDIECFAKFYGHNR